MSKKFRFYTLEELARRYSNRLIINTNNIRLEDESGFLSICLLGQTEPYLNQIPWMGEEVVEKPKDKLWQDSDDAFICIGTSRIGLISIEADTGFEANLSELKEIIQHLTDIKEYLESKDDKK